MRKWLYDNPWIWVALFLGALVAGSMVTLVIAELNKPEIVKEKRVSLEESGPRPANRIPVRPASRQSSS